jgi:predicted DNA-binding transcriptional regulator AlpA
VGLRFCDHRAARRDVGGHRSRFASVIFIMLINSNQTAQRVGVSPDHFRRSYRDWIATRGFPRPASPSRRLKWLSEAVDAWMLRQSRPEAMEVGSPDEPDPPASTAVRQRRAMREVERITRGRTSAPG